MNPDSESRIRWMELIDAVTYKPGWTFTSILQGNTPSGIYLQIKVVFPERDGDPESKVTINLIRACPIWSTVNRGMSWIFSFVKGLEEHEMDEWFKVGGFRPYEPHFTLKDTFELPAPKTDREPTHDLDWWRA